MPFVPRINPNQGISLFPLRTWHMSFVPKDQLKQQFLYPVFSNGSTLPPSFEVRLSVFLGAIHFESHFPSYNRKVTSCTSLQQGWNRHEVYRVKWVDFLSSFFPLNICFCFGFPEDTITLGMHMCMYVPAAF